MNNLLIIFWLILSNIHPAIAKEKLPVPRFVTIKFNEVNARTGPRADCPIDWIFTKKGEPVEIIAEYEQWRKIRDIKGEGGWVHSTVISGSRSIIITPKEEMTSLHSSASMDSKIIAKLHPQFRCTFIKCAKEMCQINCKSRYNYKGWVPRTEIWGVYPGE